MAIVTRQQLINLINQYIYTNGNQLITGDQLNEILLEIANAFALQSGSVTAGIEPVLATGSVVTDGRKITNEIGGTLELAGEGAFEGELHQFVGMHAADDSYEGLSYVSKAVSVIGNRKKIVEGIMALGSEPEPESEKFAAKTVFRVTDSPTTEGGLSRSADDSDKGITSSVLTDSKTVMHFLRENEVKSSVSGVDGSANSYLSVQQDAVAAFTIDGSSWSGLSVQPTGVGISLGDGSAMDNVTIRANEITTNIIQGPQTSLFTQGPIAISSTVNVGPQSSTFSQMKEENSLQIIKGPQTSAFVQRPTSHSLSLVSGPQASSFVQTPTEYSWNQNGAVALIDNKGLKLQAGKRISLTSGGSAPTAGLATLSGGTTTVTTSAVRSNSVILLTVQETGANLGNVRISAKSTGSSFTILSSQDTDNCAVFWQIIDL